MLKKVFGLFSKNNLLPIVTILLGTLSWSLTMVKSGLLYSYGVGFWGANGHDGIWHLALAKSLARGSWQMPTFSEEALKNYHVGFDLVLALLNKITQIPIETLYFQVLPPLMALAVGLLVYTFVHKWTGSKKASLLSTFFVYFGGSLGWIVTLIKSGDLGGESLFWSQQAISSLINPPFAMSIILMLVGLILLVGIDKPKKNIETLLAVLVFGILVQVKAYAGALSLGALLVAGLYEFAKERKLRLLVIFTGALVLSVTLFLPLNRNSGSLLVFKPFWFLETMMGLTDRVGWLKFYEAMLNYRSGGVWAKAILAYTIAFVVFLVGNAGTRLIAFLKIKNFQRLTTIDIFIWSVVLAGIVIPIFFLQSGTPWNTIQFFYYSLTFLGVLSGVVLAKLNNKFVLVLVLLTLPTTIITLKNDYIPSRPPAKIATEELEALRFLEKESGGVVLTYPFDSFKAKEAVENPPRPLYFYVSTAYVSAYTNKPVYLEDEVNLDITGYNWRARRDKLTWFVTTTDAAEAIKFLQDNKVKYLYLVKELSPLPGEKLKLGESQLGLTKIFGNSKVDIYRVD